MRAIIEHYFWTIDEGCNPSCTLFGFNACADPVDFHALAVRFPEAEPVDHNN